jgi:CRP-like cAMP-binding protein
VRGMFFLQSAILVGLGLLALGLPGLGQPAAEWRRTISLLRSAPDQPGLGLGTLLSQADFARLVGAVPLMAALDSEKRSKLMDKMTLHDVPEATCVIRRNEKSDAAYFILDGQAVAGWDENGATRVLEVLNPGDFFGEISALTGAPRTANVITEKPSVLVRVPAQILREMSAEPQLNRLFLTRMTERMVRMNMIDTSRLSRMDQEALRDLRTPDPEAT